MSFNPRQAHRVAHNIDWDTDGQDVEELRLPARVTITDYSIPDEGIADHLSDIYGFCIKSLELEHYAAS